MGHREMVEEALKGTRTLPFDDPGVDRCCLINYVSLIFSLHTIKRALKVK